MIQAHVSVYRKRRFGLIPAWGGCTRLPTVDWAADQSRPIVILKGKLYSAQESLEARAWSNEVAPRDQLVGSLRGRSCAMEKTQAFACTKD